MLDRKNQASDISETLALRVPSWCTAVRATVDGDPVAGDVDDGYLRLKHSWPATSTVVLELAMPARLVAPHPRVDAVRGSVALARGPLVYCVEQADLGDVALDDVRLDLSGPPRALARDDLLDVPVAITARATVVADQSAAPLYGDWPAATPPVEQREVTAIPYYRWANREPGAMRVWLPTAGDGVTARSPS